MKNLLCALLLLSGHSIMSTSSHLPSASLSGTVNLQDQAFKNLTIAGSSHLTDVDAAHLVAAGSLTAQNGTYSTATIKGACHFDNCTIKQLLTVHGGCHINNSRLHGLAIHGGITIKDSKISDKAVVHGGAHLIHCTIDDSLSVHGSLKIKNSHAINKIVVRGNIKASHCKLSDVTAHGHENELKHSTITGSIRIDKPHTTWSPVTWLWTLITGQKKQHIILTDTTIDGDIIFEKEGGIVIFNGNSSVQGNIINGSIA